MTDIDRTEVVESYLRRRGDVKLPADLTDLVVTEARVTGQVSSGFNWPMALLGVAAAAVFLGVAVMGLDYPDASDGPAGAAATDSARAVPTAMTFGPSFPLESVRPPSFATPTAAVPDAPSAFRLVEGPSICQNEEFSVYVPAGWYSHQPSGETPGCQHFATRPFADATLNNVEFPHVELEVVAIADTYATQRYAAAGELRQITFSGMPATRWSVTTDLPEPLQDRVAFEFIIYLDGPPSAGSGTLQRALRASYIAPSQQDEQFRETFTGMLGSIDMLDGTTLAAREAEADRLFAATDTCERTDIRVNVQFPDEWYANTESGPVPACMYLAPRYYEIAEPLSTPEGVEILLEVVSGGDLGFPGEAVWRRDEEINGWPAFAVETVGVPGGFTSVGVRTYAYVIGINGELPSETNTQPYLLVSTNTSLGGDYPLARSVIDRLVQRLTVTGTD